MKVSTMTPDGLKRLMLDEGTGPTMKDRLLPYWDGDGGRIDVGARGWPTIGFGRNLVRGVRYSEARLMLSNDLEDVAATVIKIAPFALADVWFDVLSMIQYNTGSLQKWPHLLLAMRNGNTSAANTEIVNSDVFRGAGKERYQRFCNAVLYRRWMFTPQEDALHEKWLATDALTV